MDRLKEIETGDLIGGWLRGNRVDFQGVMVEHGVVTVTVSARYATQASPKFQEMIQAHMTGETDLSRFGPLEDMIEYIDQREGTTIQDIVSLLRADLRGGDPHDLISELFRPLEEWDSIHSVSQSRAGIKMYAFYLDNLDPKVLEFEDPWAGPKAAPGVSSADTVLKRPGELLADFEDSERDKPTFVGNAPGDLPQDFGGKSDDPDEERTQLYEVLDVGDESEEAQLGDDPDGPSGPRRG